MCWVQHCLGTEATVRAFFCLQKKPSLTLNCAFLGEAFWLHLFLEKGGNRVPRVPPDPYESMYKNNTISSLLHIDRFIYIML